MTIQRWQPIPPRRATRPALPATVRQKVLALKRARALCAGATTAAALRIADTLAKQWTGCDCAQLLATTGKPSGAAGAGESGAAEKT